MNHDFDFATRFCRRCGASEKAVANRERGSVCDEGVVGISHIRAVERLTGMLRGFEELEDRLYFKAKAETDRGDDPPGAA